MKFRNLLPLALAGGAVALTLGVTPAFASSYGCDAQVGCATLHSVQPSYPAGYAGPQTIAVDASHKNPDGIIIGYPDLAQDQATSFDKVAHTFSHGALAGDTFYTLVYAPTGDWSNQCVTADPSTGLLSLQTCTLGHDLYQQFIAGEVSNFSTVIQAPVDIPNYAGNREYVLENVGGLNLVNPSNWTVGDIHLLRDTSTVNPLVPVPQGTYDPRQLDVDGTVGFGGGAHFTTNPHGTNGQPVSFTATGLHVPQNEQWNWHT